MTAHEGTAGEKRLTAYVVTRSELEIEPAERMPDGQIEWQEVLDQHVYSKVAMT